MPFRSPFTPLNISLGRHSQGYSNNTGCGRKLIEMQPRELRARPTGIRGAAIRKIHEVPSPLAVGVNMICNRSELNKFRGPLFGICFLAMLFCFAPKNTAAQAAPGPMGPPQSTDGATSEVPPAPPPKPVRKPIGGHPNLSGQWNINRDDSDNAEQKVRAANESSTMGDPRYGHGNNGPFGYPGGPGNGPYGGGGYPGGQRPTYDKEIPDPSIGLSRLTIDETPTSAVVMDDSGETIANYSAPDSSANSSSGNSNAAGQQQPLNAKLEFRFKLLFRQRRAHRLRGMERHSVHHGDAGNRWRENKNHAHL